MVTDPSGILARIPELEPLCAEHQAIRTAVEKGDPFKLYRVLVLARLFGQLPRHREVLKQLTRNRRLFARPLAGKLFLGTVNGFGATLLGDSEKANDGTYISTHCAVALFVIPLLPLGAYVVARAEGGGSSWHVFARVPLGFFGWAWSRGLALAALFVVLAGAAQAFLASRYATVWVANAFAHPVHVELAGQKLVLPPREKSTLLGVPAGKQRGVATTKDGETIETIELDVRAAADVVLWNVAGAAPIVLEAVDYYRVTPTETVPPSAPAQVYCGKAAVVIESVDDLFVDPPQSVSMSKGTSRVSRLHLVHYTKDETPPSFCFNYLTTEGRLAEALPLGRAHAALSGWNHEAASMAIRAALAGDAAEAMRIVERVVAAAPDNVEAHRLYQWTANLAGEMDGTKKRYGERAAKEPESAVAQYLYLRLLGLAEARKLVGPLVARFPKDPNLRRTSIYNATMSGEWRAALKGCDALQKLDAAAAARMIDDRVIAHVALGEPARALAALRAAFDPKNGATRFDHAVMYAQVAQLARVKRPELLLEEVERELGPLAHVRAQLGLPLPEKSEPTPLVDLLVATRRDPERALQLVSEVNSLDLIWLPPGIWALLTCEAARTGDAKALAALQKAQVGGSETVILHSYARGQAVELDSVDLTLEQRAAAHFVRSRHTSLSTEERAALRKAAQKDDVLHGPVSAALAAWR